MYCIRENVTFNRLDGIEKAEIKCTFSNGKEIIINIPCIISGSFIHKGNVIAQDSPSPLILTPYERTSEYLQFNFPVYCDQEGMIYTIEEI